MSNVLSAAWFLLSVQVGNLPICKHFQIHWREWTLHFNFKCTIQLHWISKVGRIWQTVYTPAVFFSLSPLNLWKCSSYTMQKWICLQKKFVRRAEARKSPFSPEIFQPYSNEAAAKHSLLSLFFFPLALANEIFILAALETSRKFMWRGHWGTPFQN